MSQVEIYNTEAEAETRQAEQWSDHLAVHNDEPYASQTTRFALPRLRNDGKWSVPVSEHSSTTGKTVVDYDENDYPEES